MTLRTGQVHRASLLFVASLFLAQAARAQDDIEGFPCEGLLAEPAQLGAVLAQVPKYGATYVLMISDRHAESIPTIDSPGVGTLRVAVYADSPAHMAAKLLAPAEIEIYPFAPGKIAEAVLAGEIDAGVVWAPLAGLAVLELDFEYELSLLTAGLPSAAPRAQLGGGATVVSSRAACPAEIEGQLEGYGVVPAEKLVQLDIRDFLHLRPPERDFAEAAEGSLLYEEHCAKCHGVGAVAEPDALAPVDLLVSTPRFSFPGFLYIVLNGRSSNGMPGFNGSISREHVQAIYQFVRERSHGTILQPAEESVPESSR